MFSSCPWTTLNSDSDATQLPKVLRMPVPHLVSAPRRLRIQTLGSLIVIEWVSLSRCFSLWKYGESTNRTTGCHEEWNVRRQRFSQLPPSLHPTSLGEGIERELLHWRLGLIISGSQQTLLKSLASTSFLVTFDSLQKRLVWDARQQQTAKLNKHLVQCKVYAAVLDMSSVLHPTCWALSSSFSRAAASDSAKLSASSSDALPAASARWASRRLE